MTEAEIKAALAKHQPRKHEKTGNIIVLARLSFPNLFHPTKPKDAPADQKAKYNTALLLPKGTDVRLLVQTCIERANGFFGERGWFADLPSGKRAGTPPEKGLKTQPVKLTFPFRDGADQVQFGGFEEGTWYFNTTSDKRPGVVDRRGNPISEDSDEIYAGAWVLVSLRDFAYDVGVKKGVSLGLQNVQKFRDDEPLAGRSRAEDEFEQLDGEEDDYKPRSNGADESSMPDFM
jgi:hypothetical protein